MDGQMPDMDGFHATRLIRSSQDPDVRSVRIIAVTASAAQGDREKCLDAGMEYVMFCFSLGNYTTRAEESERVCVYVYQRLSRQAGTS
jgi:CheY-like chemotaxis protein